jgi:hypothetical protein
MAGLLIGRTSSDKPFTLPTEAVTQTFAILSKRGAGKTYCASVMAEEMLGAGLHVVVADPIGVWWGLRAAADGRGPGLPIIVLGGSHGDLPLELASGELVADLVVDEGLSLVLDLSLFRKGEQTRFMTDFCERLYHRNREPLHLFLDEADAFAPQRPMHGQERMLGAVEDLVRRGRARGIGVTLISQRSAVLNKDVLTQAEVLVALRTIAPQDRDAVDAWVKVHGTPEQREVMMGSLPSLPVGTAWFWSPGWLEVFERVRVRERKTFDSSATPKVGEVRAAPKQMAPVDLEALRARLAGAIERAQREDPRLLRKQISELERELAKLRRDKAVTCGHEGELASLRSSVSGWEHRFQALHSAADAVLEALRVALEAWRRAIDSGPPLRIVKGNDKPPPPEPRPPPPSPPRPFTPDWRRARGAAPRASGEMRAEEAIRRVRGGDSNGRLARAERLILSALAQYPQGRSVTQLALLTGYSSRGGGFRNALGALRSAGYVEGRGPVVLTAAGADAIGTDSEPLPAPGPELVQYWLGRLPRAERLILEVLAERYPEPIEKEEVASLTGYEASGGGFRNAMGRLRTLDLIEGYGRVKAADSLMSGD